MHGFAFAAGYGRVWAQGLAKSGWEALNLSEEAIDSSRTLGMVPAIPLPLTLFFVAGTE